MLNDKQIMILKMVLDRGTIERKHKNVTEVDML
jgi:hypothetical protein